VASALLPPRSYQHSSGLPTPPSRGAFANVTLPLRMTLWLSGSLPRIPQILKCLSSHSSTHSTHDQPASLAQQVAHQISLRLVRRRFPQALPLLGLFRRHYRLALSAPASFQLSLARSSPFRQWVKLSRHDITRYHIGTCTAISSCDGGGGRAAGPDAA
jgi:hypothetical protein